MRCKTDSEACSRRRTVASLLVFAKELEKSGRISKASKGLLKELIVHENAQVMSIGDGLARADEAGDQAGLALEKLEELIKHRASKSHQELFEICSLEEAHLLSQHDTEALTEGVDTKSLVYGEIDFGSFYDVIKVAAHGIDTNPQPKEKTMLFAPLAEPPTVCEFTQTRQPLMKRQQRQQQQQQEEDQQQQGGEEQHQERRRWRCSDEDNDDGAGSRSPRQAEREGPRCDGTGGENVAGDDGRKAAANGEKMAVDRTSRKRLGVAVEATVIGSSGGGDGTGGGTGGDGGSGGGGRGQEGLKFYDLGSGSGRAVFAAVLAVDFRCAVGIELLAGIHHASTRVLKRYRKLVEPVLCSPAVVKLYHGSFLEPECDWSDGDLIFANSTCFAEDTQAAIAERAALLRPGARVVTFTTALKTPWLRVLLKKRYQMSWGPATVFVHEKLSREEHAARLTETTPFDEDQGMSRGGGFSTAAAPPPPASPAPPASPPSPPSVDSGSDNEGIDRVDEGSSSSSSCGFRLGSEVGWGRGSAISEEEEEEEEEEREEEEGGVGQAAYSSSSPRRPLHC